MNNQQGTGRNVTYTNGAVTTIRSGGPVVFGQFAGVCKSVERNNVPLLPGQASAAGDRVVVAFEGVYTMGKTAGLAINLGDAVYLNTGSQLLTKTNTDVPFGIATVAALAGDSTVVVTLRQWL
jgi:predicted RecA/RadA family phage recombinase